jgi:hypothetical protein
VNQLARAVFMLGALAIATALPFASAVGASAADPSAGEIVFSAQATITDGHGVPTIGGNGTYTFSSNDSTLGLIPGECVASQEEVEGGSPLLNQGLCDLESPNGRYTSIVCGTGLAQDNLASVTVNGILGDTDVTNLDYSIVFVAGLGVITPVAVAPVGATGSTAAESDGGTGLSQALTGLVQITPTSGTCATPVFAFRATGVALTAA